MKLSLKVALYEHCRGYWTAQYWRDLAVAVRKDGDVPGVIARAAEEANIYLAASMALIAQIDGAIKSASSEVLRSIDSDHRREHPEASSDWAISLVEEAEKDFEKEGWLLYA